MNDKNKKGKQTFMKKEKGTVKTNRSKKNYGSGKFKRRTFGKIKNIDWDSIKPEENKIGGRFDFSI